MQIVRERPEEGKFIAVWEFGDGIWSYAYRWKDGVLQRYETESDIFSNQDKAIDDFPFNQEDLYYVVHP